jgi:4-coumarate--CoA ligase
MKRGERGELVFQSPSLLNCYLNNEAATTAAFDEDGWYRTGDVGIIDENDNVYIVDRLKEVIKVKGCVC